VGGGAVEGVPPRPLCANKWLNAAARVWQCCCVRCGCAWGLARGLPFLYGHMSRSTFFRVSDKLTTEV